jgi:hypothetical protein
MTAAEWEGEQWEGTVVLSEDENNVAIIVPAVGFNPSSNEQ